MLELLSRLLQPLRRLVGQRTAILPIGRRLPHVVRRFLQPTGRVLQVLARLSLPLGFAGQLLELPRRALGFIRQLTLARSAALATLLQAPGLPLLLLGLLQLPARQLTQLLGKLVHLLLLLSALLAALLGALLRLVLIRVAVLLELEQIGQLFGHRSATATAPAATAAALLADFKLVELLGLLQELQCAVLRRQGVLGLVGLQQSLCLAHLLGGLGQQVGDLADVLGRAGAQPLAHLLHEFIDFRAELALRETHEDGVFLDLVGRGPGAIALDVERRSDDLPLLFGERARLVLLAAATPASATAAATFLRLRLAHRLVEGPDLDEVDVARRRLRALHGVVVGRLGVVGNRVARLDAEFLEIHGVARPHFAVGLGPLRIERDRLLLAAVDRVDQLAAA